MQRRHLMGLLASSTALALPGCGFALRGTPNFPFSSLYLALSEASPLGVELKRQLESSDKVRVITNVRDMGQAQVILDVLSDQREKTAVGVNVSGQVREFQLRMRFRFRLRTPGGKELIPETTLSQSRDISFSESAVLAKEAEDVLLYRDMQSAIVQQIMRRLSAIPSL